MTASRNSRLVYLQNGSQGEGNSKTGVECAVKVSAGPRDSPSLRELVGVGSSQ